MDGEETLRRVERALGYAYHCEPGEEGSETIYAFEEHPIYDCIRTLEELERELRYDFLTAPRVGAPTEPGNTQATLG